MPASIDFYFDYISPYAYIAWKELPKLAERYGGRSFQGSTGPLIRCAAKHLVCSPLP